MGPPERTPPLPEWEFALVPAPQRFVSKRLQECNWLQAMEGGIDSSHVSLLHRGAMSFPIRCSAAPKATNTTWAT